MGCCFEAVVVIVPAKLVARVLALTSVVLGSRSERSSEGEFLTPAMDL